MESQNAAHASNQLTMRARYVTIAQVFGGDALNRDSAMANLEFGRLLAG
jgi:hypothetical protein